MLLNDYQTAATGTAIYPGQGTVFGAIYCALKMNGEAGEFAEHLGKAMRDDGLMTGFSGLRAGDEQPVPFEQMGQLTEARRTALIKELGDVLWYVAAASTELGVTLADVGQANLDKLADRKARGQLQGSGDNR
jgi:NTP pyrophosphatase (non-canonical NTP hydrolase)